MIIYYLQRLLEQKYFSLRLTQESHLLYADLRETRYLAKKYETNSE
jgi:hypothetical protein